MSARGAAIGFVAALAACAGAPKRDVKPAEAKQATAADAGVADMTPAPGAEVASLDDLAAPAASLLMHEVKRAADVTTPIAVDAAQADTCFRANVGASRAVRAWFEDAGHAIRGEVAERAGLVPPRGPVCAKKGDELRLVVMAPNAGTVTRAVVFAAP